uniref:Uncharacterized protein n=1 Tax=Pithovirus LCPAC202 TaxID=2506592 RepID=A0A481Z6S3_9VIRU|nr:MAG: uncharacterized protein LCPAC202_00760 [Pithovirus LCPAC202]
MQDTKDVDRIIGNTDSWKIEQKINLEREKFLKIYTSLRKDIDSEPGQNFLVLIYLLQNPPRGGLHGSLFPVGVYSTREHAERKAAQLCSDNHVDSVRIFLMTDWGDIIEKCPANRVKYTTSDSKLVSLEDIRHQKKVNQYKKEVKFRDELEEEHLRSNKLGTIEHYQYSWYRAVKHKSKMEYLKRQLDETEKAFKVSAKAIQVDFEMNPSLDETWLPDLKTKLGQRKELDVYNAIVLGYDKLKKEVLEKKKRRNDISTT